MSRKSCFFCIFKIDDTPNEISTFLMVRRAWSSCVLWNSDALWLHHVVVLKPCVAETTVFVTSGAFFSGPLFGHFFNVAKALNFCMLSGTLCLATQVLVWLGAHCSRRILRFWRCSLFSRLPWGAKFVSVSRSARSCRPLRDQHRPTHGCFRLACFPWSSKSLRSTC